MTLLRRILAGLRDRQGAVAVEFAFIALPLMLLLGGSIEIGRHVWTRLALQDAASAGARCLGLGLSRCVTGGTMDLDGTVSLVREQGSAWAIVIPDGAVTAERAGACPGVDDFSRIGIRQSFSFVLGVLPETWIEVEACFPVIPSK